MASVLVVDDNEANRELVITLLGYGGHRVTAAIDGRDALEIALREPPDLVICDLVMPNMDGYELMREMRQQSNLAAVPAIFCTANYVEREVRPVADALGVRHVIAKPIDPRQLMRTVDEALSTRASTAPVVSDGFASAHRRAVSAKLSAKVDELERTEAALVASEARFRSLAENSPLGIFSLDAMGSISYANPRLLAILGRRAGTPDLDWRIAAHPGDRNALAEGLAFTISSGRPHEQRLRVVRPDGGMRWIDLHLAPVADGSAEVTFVGTVDDVTVAVDAQRERDEIAQRLLQSERLESLGELAAGIAHDFNNALSVIMTYNEFVRHDLDTAEVDQVTLKSLIENTEAVNSAAERAAGLTNRLLVFARRGMTKPELVDANEVMREAVTLLAPTVGANVTLIDALDTASHPMMADRTQLEQLIVNLVINARDAIEAKGHGGTVRITTVRTIIDEADSVQYGLSSGHYSRITVDDDGCGMTERVVSRMFEPFFTTKRIGEGSGLGLSTVYGIVKSLHGAISASSEPGRGTSMRVLLPLES